MIRGLFTSEFWVVAATVLNLIITQYTGAIESVGEVGGETLVQVIGEPWAAIGAAVTAGLYALGRGLAKGLGAAR